MYKTVDIYYYIRDYRVFYYRKPKTRIFNCTKPVLLLSTVGRRFYEYFVDGCFTHLSPLSEEYNENANITSNLVDFCR